MGPSHDARELKGHRDVAIHKLPGDLTAVAIDRFSRVVVFIVVAFPSHVVFNLRCACVHKCNLSCTCICTTLRVAESYYRGRTTRRYLRGLSTRRRTAAVAHRYARDSTHGYRAVTDTRCACARVMKTKSGRQMMMMMMMPRVCRSVGLSRDRP